MKPGKMKCPFCNDFDTRVVDSRIHQSGDLIRRRRECSKCTGRFTTFEKVEHVMPVVIKRDGRREPYSHEKLFGGIQKACQKRPVTTQQVDEIVSRIERKIHSSGLREVPSSAIGQMVMGIMHKIDSVAYVRFASVYRKFADVDEFVAELQEKPEEMDDLINLTFPFAADSENFPPDQAPRPDGSKPETPRSDAARTEPIFKSEALRPEKEA